MMIKLSDMREILLKHQIENCMHYDKKQLIVLLGEKGLLPSKQEKVKKERSITNLRNWQQSEITPSR